MPLQLLLAFSAHKLDAQTCLLTKATSRSQTLTDGHDAMVGAQKRDPLRILFCVAPRKQTEGSHCIFFVSGTDIGFCVKTDQLVARI